jgi:hypothetical protein
MSCARGSCGSLPVITPPGVSWLGLPYYWYAGRTNYQSWDLFAITSRLMGRLPREWSIQIAWRRLPTQDVDASGQLLEIWQVILHFSRKGKLRTLPEADLARYQTVVNQILRDIRKQPGSALLLSYQRLTDNQGFVLPEWWLRSIYPTLHWVPKYQAYLDEYGWYVTLSRRHPIPPTELPSADGTLTSHSLARLFPDTDYPGRLEQLDSQLFEEYQELSLLVVERLWLLYRWGTIGADPLVDGEWLRLWAVEGVGSAGQTGHQLYRATWQERRWTSDRSWALQQARSGPVVVTYLGQQATVHSYTELAKFYEAAELTRETRGVPVNWRVLPLPETEEDIAAG